MQFWNFFFVALFFSVFPMCLSGQAWENETPYEIVTGTGYSPDQKIAFNKACIDMIKQALQKRIYRSLFAKNTKKIDAIALSYKKYIESKPTVLEWDGERIRIKGKVKVAKALEDFELALEENQESSQYEKYFPDKDNSSATKKTQENKVKESSQYEKYFSDKDNSSSTKKTQENKVKESSQYEKYFSEEESVPKVKKEPKPKETVSSKQEIVKKETTKQPKDTSSLKQNLPVPSPEPQKNKKEVEKKQPVAETKTPKSNPQLDKIAQGKPIDIVKALAKAAKEKKGEEFGFYCSEDIQKSLEKINSILGERDNSCLLRFFDIYALCMPMEEKIQGDSALVKITGLTSIESFFLVKEKGKWKYQGYILSSGKKRKYVDSLEKMYSELEKFKVSLK